MASTVLPIISTADLPLLETFYREVFDASEILRVPGDGDTFFVQLSIGDGAIGIVNEAPAVGEGSQRILISIEVGNVDEVLQRVEDAGGSAPAAPNDMPWGQRVAHITDPDGNAINLTHAI